jgi:hypothetical protein
MSFSNEQTDTYGMVRQIVLDKFENNDSDKNGLNIDSVIIVVCKRFGVEADIDFVGLDRLLDADALETIANQSDSLITAIESRFAAICKERGLDPMTLYNPAEPSAESIAEPPKDITAVTSSHNGTKLDDEPTYSKEQRSEILTGIEFNQYLVKPLTEETENEINDVDKSISAFPLEKEVEEVRQSTPPALSTPKLLPVEKPTPVTPTEPPTLKHPPDTTITITERNQYGYTRPELLPLNKDRAIALFRREMTIFLLHKDNTEAIALYDSDIHNHNGIFGIAYGVWQNSREYIGLASGNLEDRLEAKFIFDTGDSFAVYQTEPDKSPAAYKSYDELQKNLLSIDRRQYHLIYTAPLPDPPSDTPTGIFMWVTASEQLLEGYKGRAMAISDILSIKKDGVITSHYANGQTFKQLLDFVGEEGRGIVREREKEVEVKKTENTADYSSSAKEIALNEKQTIETVISSGNNDEATVTAATEQPHQSQTQTQPQIEHSASSASSATPVTLTETMPSTEIIPGQTTALQTASKETVETTHTESTLPTQTKPPALPVIKSDLALFRVSAKEAEEHGTTELYELDRRMNRHCAKTIANAIRHHKKGDNSYDMATPADRLIRSYGKERMMWVLSKQILAAPKGFSEANRSWAESFVNDGTGSGDDIPAFTIDIHHALLDIFINEIRASLDKNPSFNERMKAAKKKSEAFNKSNG